MSSNGPKHLADAVLTQDIWATVNERLLSTMLSSFMYEDLIDPTVLSDDDPAVVSDDDQSAASDTDPTQYRLEFPEATYRFAAHERLFDSYSVVPGSVERRGEDAAWESVTDVVQFLLDFQSAAEIDDGTVSHLIREYTNTLLADAHLQARMESRASDFDPTALNYAELDGELAGHPWITYNKGRIGFGYEDYQQYAPEQRTPSNVLWTAVRTSKADTATLSDLQYDEFVASELGTETYETFADRLRDRGLDPASYTFAPVHRWQWDNSIVQFYAADIAADDIVPLGESPDRYLPQQSIRTLVNVDSPENHHLKLSLRILNTLVYRGIPGTKLAQAPAITEFLWDIYESDSFLKDECRLVLPGEVATLHYEHDTYAGLDGAPYQFSELFGSLWRESVPSLIDDSEEAIPLAALLHVDGSGTPYVSRLVEESGMELSAWLDHLFEALLYPLLHYFYAYGVGFSPHGEDTIVILEDGVPTRVGLKDFIDLSISETELPELERLPAEIRSVLGEKPPARFCQCIVASLFLGVFRYLADLLERHHDYDEQTFWRQVRATILAYQERFPQLERRFELFDLFQPEFTRLCLNRNRILEYGYGDAPSRPSICEHGTVRNALVEVAPESDD
ncbi:IucA/IucC family protein (plasmid) [Haloferax sp. S1W]|uniref:IucA/IucC family protein n=1 Tax=Haloferax sp. S1W TaxID=3377110 RepID=UPI0037CBB2AC